MPSSLLLNTELFSSYKNHVTLKALVGIAACGDFDLDFDDDDVVMANKGFQIQD